MDPPSAPRRPAAAAGSRGPSRPGGGRRVVRAWAVAAALSGAPSTAWALATGRDPLEAARAAAAVLPGSRTGLAALAAGAGVHAAVAAWWTAVLAAVLPRRSRAAGAAAGAVAGAGIAAFDLGVVARRLPAVRALPRAPQWADHLAFGALAGAVLAGGCDPAGRARP